MLHGWLSQFRFQLLKARQPEGKTVEGCQEDGRRPNLRLVAGVGQRRSGSAEVENFIQVTGEGGEFVNRPILLSHKCKMASLRRDAVPSPGILLSLSFTLTFPGALTPQQFAVDLGDLFQVVLQLVVVLDPTADFSHLLLGNDSTGGASAPQSDRQIPDRAMPLAASAPSGRVPAGYITLDQRTT